jgi:hypothetical protein
LPEVQVDRPIVEGISEMLQVDESSWIIQEAEKKIYAERDGQQLLLWQGVGLFDWNF